MLAIIYPTFISRFFYMFAWFLLPWSMLINSSHLSSPPLWQTGQPSQQPSNQPSAIPSSQPSNQPSAQPIMRPTGDWLTVFSLLLPLLLPFLLSPFFVPCLSLDLPTFFLILFPPLMCPLSFHHMTFRRHRRSHTGLPSCQPSNQPSAQPIMRPTGVWLTNMHALSCLLFSHLYCFTSSHLIAFYFHKQVNHPVNRAVSPLCLLQVIDWPT